MKVSKIIEKVKTQDHFKGAVIEIYNDRITVGYFGNKRKSVKYASLELDVDLEMDGTTYIDQTKKYINIYDRINYKELSIQLQSRIAELEDALKIIAADYEYLKNGSCLSIAFIMAEIAKKALKGGEG